MRLTFERLWVAIAIALPALVALVVSLPAVDLAYQVRAGDEILRTGALPAVDSYTFTIAGAPWTDQQWLAQVILAAVHQVGGWELLAVLRAALVVSITGLLVAASIARGAAPRTGAVLSLLAFMLLAPALALRPQLFGIVIFVALLLLTALRHRRPSMFLGAPLLVVLWANVHGSFVLAPLLLAYAWLDDLVAGRPARRSLAVLVLGTAATLVNPFGPTVWTYAAGIGADPTISGQVSEWQRTSPFTVPGLLFYASAAVALAVAIRRRAALRWPDWVWLAGMFVIGAWAVRGLAWWPLGAVYVLAPVLAGPAVQAAGLDAGPARSSGRPTRDRLQRLNGLVVAVLELAIVVALPWWRPADALTGRAGLLSYSPSALADALRGEVSNGSRVLAPQAWTSWLEWAVPDARYFVDARFELFPGSVWADYDVMIGGGPGAATALDRWAVDVVVLPAGSDPPSAGWTRRYADDDGAIYARSGAG